MTPDTTNERLARVEENLKSLLDAVNRLTDKIDRFDRNYVPRAEYEVHKAALEKRFEGQGQDISDIREEIAGRRAPWWAVASVVIAGLAVAWNILTQLTQQGV